MAVAKALREVEGSVSHEVAAARAAWPVVLGGIPSHLSAEQRSRIEAAADSAARVPLPALLGERGAAALTGPASPLAGRYRDFVELSATSWKLIAAAVREIEDGAPAAAKFARATVALYIEGVYDAHYSLGETGQLVLAAYKTLGGAGVMGPSLTQAEVDELVGSYSRGRDRVEPHERVKLGS